MKDFKLTLMSLAMLVACFATACANDKVITVNELPQTAQNFLSKYFSAKQVAIVKVDGGWNKEYEVNFSDGSKVEFNDDGEWKDVKCRDGVPSGIIPENIVSQIKNSNDLSTGLFIQQVELDKKRGRTTYDVKLSNGMEYEFDGNGQMIDMDF